MSKGSHTSLLQEPHPGGKAGFHQGRGASACRGQSLVGEKHSSSDNLHTEFAPQFLLFKHLEEVCWKAVGFSLRAIGFRVTWLKGFQSRLPLRKGPAAATLGNAESGVIRSDIVEERKFHF